MNINKTGIWIFTLITISVIATITGCSNSPLGRDNSVQAYSDTAELMLQAINHNDYAAFSSDFNVQMKQSMTAPAFNKFATAIRNKIGTYIADRVYGMQEQSGNMVVTFKAKFIDEPSEVTVTITFQKAHGKSLVADFNLDSPKFETK